MRVYKSHTLEPSFLELVLVNVSENFPFSERNIYTGSRDAKGRVRADLEDALF